ncbi:MAG: tetratricopeptide repeat protein [Rectinemataceae bacterium]
MDEAMSEASRLAASRDWLGALGALRDVEPEEGNQFEIAYLFGICHARLCDWDNALLYLEQVVTGGLDPARDGQCRMALAYVYTVTGRHRLAEYELERLRLSGFETVQVFAFLGYSAWAQGRSEDSLRWYAKALDLDPENANALNGMGYLLACEGKDGARALTFCRKAVDMVPDNPAYRDSLAWAYFKLGFLDEARNQIGLALSLSPSATEIREHAWAIERGGMAFSEAAVPPRSRT